MKVSRELIWEVSLYLKPKPKQSVRMGSGHGYVPPTLARYLAKLRGLMEKSRPPEPFCGPLELEVIFIYPFNKSESKERCERGWYMKDVRPDLDNLEKPLDALVKAKIIKDDSCIVHKDSWKIAKQGSEGEILIKLRRLKYC